METKARFVADEDVQDFDSVVAMLRSHRDEILRDWLERVRDNRAIETGQMLSDPVLLDHMPQLFDSMLDRMEMGRTRDEAEQLAAVHGFARRVSGYDVVESVVELLMFRRAIWTQLGALETSAQGGLAVMERVDGMVDRAVITSLKAFLDPSARMMMRSPVPASSDHASESASRTDE